jgi:multiple sugar transport system permease protein
MAVTDAAPEIERTNAAASRRNTMARRFARLAALFYAPTAFLLLLLVAWPLVNVVWQGFHYVNLVDPATTGFAGLDNYRTILEDEDFLPAVVHTGVWTILSVAGEYALGLISAIALAQPVKGRAVFRGIIVIPWVIPIVIAGLNWMWLLNPDYGILNAWMVKLGLIDHARDWLGGLDTSLLTVTFVNIWRSFPFYTISLLAAMQAVPRDLHEAAAMDGASTLRRFFVITMPHLKTVSLTLIFIHVVWTAINFDFIWVMTQGGPLNASQTLPVMIYQYAMQNYDVGAACALASMSMAFMATTFFVYFYATKAKGAR